MENNQYNDQKRAYGAHGPSQLMVILIENM
ncbi:MAG: L-lactate utilization protein LutC [Psychromonas sp.]|jgi:L-lactate utilization protein LutC